VRTRYTRAVHEFADHFSKLSPAYAAFRPVYPRSLAAWLAELAPSRALAWDCGTGNGQAALLVAEHFERVVATDASVEQLAHARPHPRVEYRSAPAERSGLAGASVDLITVAAAIHWFELDAFYAEAERVLRARGVLAAFSYDLVHVSPDVDRVLEWFYTERVGRYWPRGRRHVETRYRELAFPFPEIEFGARAIEADIDRGALLGYVGTWSAVARCKLSEGRDPIPELEERLASAWPDPAHVRRAVWPLFGRVGRNEAR
jgi:ubiquinone/menaquinone biosynthesis C-methylase UbiE